MKIKELLSSLNELRELKLEKEIWENALENPPIYEPYRYSESYCKGRITRCNNRIKEIEEMEIWREE